MTTDFSNDSIVSPRIFFGDNDSPSTRWVESTVLIMRWDTPDNTFRKSIFLFDISLPGVGKTTDRSIFCQRGVCPSPLPKSY